MDNFEEGYTQPLSIYNDYKHVKGSQQVLQ